MQLIKDIKYQPLAFKEPTGACICVSLWVGGWCCASFAASLFEADRLLYYARYIGWDAKGAEEALSEAVLGQRNSSMRQMVFSLPIPPDITAEAQARRLFCLRVFTRVDGKEAVYFQSCRCITVSS